MPKMITFHSCHNCPHVDHSGAFTVGGAKTICGHNETCKKRGYEWYKRTIKSMKGKFPSWCPLPNTSN